MMLTNNRKVKQAKGIKTEPDFDSILEQVLSLDTQKKTSESRSMKTAAKGNESKKPSHISTITGPYCSKGGHTKDKCYYKHLERASKSFRERFKTPITDLRSRHSGSTNAQENGQDIRNCGWVVRAHQIPSNSALSTGTHDTSWYFDNAASYHMIYDINDFESLHQLTPCISPQDDITLVDGSIILPDGIGKIWFGFEESGSTKRLYLSEVRYCKKLDTKLISLGMLDRKGLAYSAEKRVLLVKDNATTVKEGQLDKHNLYRVTLNNSMVTSSIQDRAIAASTFKSPADIVTWHRRFAHLNATYLKRLLNMTSGMKILSKNSELPFCAVCVKFK